MKQRKGKWVYTPILWPMNCSYNELLFNVKILGFSLHEQVLKLFFSMCSEFPQWPVVFTCFRGPYLMVLRLRKLCRAKSYSCRFYCIASSIWLWLAVQLWARGAGTGAVYGAYFGGIGPLLPLSWAWCCCIIAFELQGVAELQSFAVGFSSTKLLVSRLRTATLPQSLCLFTWIGAVWESRNWSILLYRINLSICSPATHYGELDLFFQNF
jgi:hypothetical protein